MRRLTTAFFAALPLLAADITEIGDRAYHVILAATDRQASIPNPDGLAVFVTSALGKSCWDPALNPALGCVGPGGSGMIPARDVTLQPNEFIDPTRPAGALVHKTEGGRTRLAVNDRDNDGAFADNTGQFEFDVFLAPRASTEGADREWIASRLLPLTTPEAGNGFDDMQALRDVVRGSRLVSLGEATHGSREFFQLKHRILEFLATEMRFSIFSIEASMPEAYRLNDYVLNGVGDPAALIRGMYFWTWQTEEVLGMVKWMREYNASGRGRLQFTGFDMQTPNVAAQNAREFAARHDLDLLPELDRIHRDVVRRAGQGAGAFGVAVGTLPLAAAAGKRVRYTGYIKTENISRGYAGLWWRTDGRTGTLFLDNMSARGPRGTTDWRQYEISVNVPADATNLAFGVLHPGDGTAWFDNLTVEVDGVPFSDDRFDFDFESPAIRGFLVGGDGYTLTLDNAVAQRGRQSLRSRLNLLPDAELVSGSAAMVQRMEAARESYRAKGVPSADIEWAIQNARLVYQYMAHLRSPFEMRDRFMAENVKWIADQNPDAGIVLWAHNGHVATAGYSFETMGSHLRRDFGEEMVVFGFAFNKGGFQAIDATTFALREFAVPAANAGSLDALLASAEKPVFALDLREAPRVGPGALLRQILPTRSIGSVYNTRFPDAYFVPIDAAAAYDAILFVDTTTRARPMQQ